MKTHTGKHPAASRDAGGRWLDLNPVTDTDQLPNVGPAAPTPEKQGDSALFFARPGLTIAADGT